ncbi:hypothetical protein NQ315_000962 [Exocentrus adspersus]|uniref:Uncharacterized protein n=1 Tax=Exocentrus adspersus TaxID=1586481 RepID=A0AAV8WE67_9CUCU|nr:hypothetical protein NQ315_000962 [Exocentrus adspersus]
MSFLSSLEAIKASCRICLTASENMISLGDKLDEKCEDSPILREVLEDMLMVKVENITDYPTSVCRLCKGNIRILHDMKALFTKSQNILKKYVSSLQQFNEINASCTKSPPPAESCIDEATDLMPEIEGDSDIEIYQEEDAQQDTAPTKIIKIVVDLPKPKTVKTQRVEGNKCRQCQKQFPSQESLSTHLNTCQKNVKCQRCNRKFFSERILRNHLRFQHGIQVVAQYKCELCDETFKNPNARSYHKITRHNTKGKKYTCDVCGKAFFFKNSLEQHLDCHSKDVSKAVCSVCGKSFHYRGALFYHMKVHRNERNYTCSFCNSKHLNMAALKRHMRTHTGERPYPCSFCPKSFCSQSEVRAHERRHTGQKPHQCKYCKKTFITPYSLKLHISAHSGTEPCNLCGRSYLNDEALKYHKEMKHHVKQQVDDAGEVMDEDAAADL